MIKVIEQLDRAMHRNQMRLVQKSPVRAFYIGKDRPLAIEITECDQMYRFIVVMMDQPIAYMKVHKYEIETFGVKLIDVVCRNWQDKRRDLSHMNLGTNIEEFIKKFQDAQDDF